MRNPTHRHGVSPDDMAEIILLDSPGVSPGRVFNRLFQDARHPSHMPPGGDNQPLKHGGATETRRFPDCTRLDQLVIITGAKCLEMNRIKIGRAHVELQSLMRISYAVFCLKKKKTTTPQRQKIHQ